MCTQCETARVRVSPSKLSSKHYVYSVKVVNPVRKSEYTVRKLSTYDRFSSFDELTEQLQKCLDKISPSQIGYIEPGHGLKGKQRWLYTDEDVDTMYDIYKRKTEILLWCFSENPEGSEITTCSKSKKAETSSKSKKEAIASKINEEVQDKHGNQYSVEKCNAWAHLIHVGKHDSHDDPPDLPYFRGTKKRKLQTASEGRENSPPSPQAASKSSPSIITSPSKRVGLRSQCIEQLVKWHSLLEKGAISQLQYDEMQKAIMEEIKSNY